MASSLKYIECVLLIEEHREPMGNGWARLSKWSARGSVMTIVFLEGILFWQCLSQLKMHSIFQPSNFSLHDYI